MAYKTDRGRIDETLTFIQNLALAPEISPGGVQQAYQFASGFITRRHAAVWGRNPAMHTFSQEMSLGNPYLGPETQIDRKQRRAIYLLLSAIRDATNPVAGSPLPPGPRTYVNLQRTLLDTVWKARLMWGQANASTAPHTDLMAWLRTNALLFLGTNVIHIAGSTHQAVDHLGAPTDQNVRQFCMKYNAVDQRYEFGPGALANSLHFDTASVKAVHWSLVPARGVTPLAGTFAQIHGTELGGLNVDTMMTTQFTGCSFCIKQHGGNVYAAHISPAGPGFAGALVLNGQTLARQLDGLEAGVVGGDFANAPGGPGPFVVYGRGHSNIAAHPAGYPLNGRMYLFGLLHGGVWSVYSQTQTDARAITGAVQIF